MTSLNGKVQIEWLVACLSPGDVAPHPNFRNDAANGAELLGLIVQFNWQEYQTYRDLLDDEEGSSTDIDKGFLDAARSALDAATQQEGHRLLLNAAENEDLPLSQRAAAALLVACTDSELDEPEAHLEVLDRLAAQIEQHGKGSRSSRGLAVAILLQQRALRALEAGRTEEARISAQRAIDSLATKTDDWDSFVVSRGISWTSADSQRRLAELIGINARSLLVSTGDFQDESWTEIVRAPFPAADARFRAQLLSGLGAVLDNNFAKEFAGLERVREIGKSDLTIRSLYSSLLHAELAGAQDEVARLRHLAGSVISTQFIGASDDSWLTEAIRLLRQGDSENNLRRLLQSIRMQGPLEKLRSAAESLSSIRQGQGFATTSDLALFDRAADLLSVPATDQAIRVALSYPKQKRFGRVRGSSPVEWKRLETSLKVVNALVAGNERIDMGIVASSVLDLIESVEMPSVENQSFFRIFAGLSTSINWTSVSERTRMRWINYLNGLASSPNVLVSDGLRAWNALGAAAPADVRARARGLEYVAILVTDLLGKTPAPNDIEYCVSLTVDALQAIKTDATNGRYVGYGWPPLTLAAYLVMKFGRMDVWQVLVSALTDPLVSNDGKIDAMRVLTTEANRSVLPKGMAEGLSSFSLPWATSAGASRLFGTPKEEFDVVCRNMYAAFGLLSPTDVRRFALQDVSSAESAVRVEAADTCLLSGSGLPTLEWPQILLLQLSHDRDSTVRNAASQSLAYMSVIPDLKLADAVTDRVSSLLDEPGIAVPLGALKGLEAASHEMARFNPTLWCVDSVQRLTREHPSQNVRIAARSVIKRYEAENQELS